MSQESLASINLEWPHRLFLDRTAYQKKYVESQPDTTKDIAEKVLELTTELKADLITRHPELDEDNQRQTTS